jgi:hypothetical protein
VRRYGEEYGGSVRFGLWLAVQRYLEGSRLESESQIERFLLGIDWAIKPTVASKSLPGNWGISKRSGKKIVEIRAFSALFVAT